MNPDKNDFTMLDRLIRFNIVFHPERLGIYMDKVKAALTPKQFKVIFLWRTSDSCGTEIKINTGSNRYIAEKMLHLNLV